MDERPMSPSAGPAQALEEEKRQLKPLRNLVEEAVMQRGKYYRHHFTFAIRFVADNTKASEDTKHFQHLLKLWKLPKAQELIIPLAERDPTTAVRQIVDSIQNQLANLEGRALIIGHYAGHGELNSRGDLIFYASPVYQRFIRYDSAFEELLTNTPMDEFKDADVILLLDSCYSGVATRGVKPLSRSVEVIAAIGVTQQALGNHANISRIQNQTFTSRLADKVAYQLAQGQTAFSMNSLVIELQARRNLERQPQYNLQVGNLPIWILITPSSCHQSHRRQIASSTGSFNSATSSITGVLTPFSQSAASETTAIFSVNLPHDDPADADVKEVVKWIHSLHPSLGITLKGLYRSNSTVLLFEVPWRIWTTLNGIEGFSLVCKAVGGNLLGKSSLLVKSGMAPSLVLLKILTNLSICVLLALEPKSQELKEKSESVRQGSRARSCPSVETRTKKPSVLAKTPINLPVRTLSAAGSKHRDKGGKIENVGLRSTS